jgi:hypothetical protein
MQKTSGKMRTASKKDRKPDPALAGRSPITHARRFDLSLPPRNQTFGSSEHRGLGDFVKLMVPAIYDAVVPTSWKSGKLRVGHSELSYGEIVALAGDLYGVPSRPISSGTSDADRRARFRAAFETLEKAPKREVDDLLGIINEEGQHLQSEMIKGAPANLAAAQKDFDNAFVMATGGKFYMDPSSRYLQLASRNFDHFGPDAVTAYRAGHAEALAAALEGFELAKNSGARAQAFAKYERALALNAFADHFLTDLFSSGHLRVPRRNADAQHGETTGGIVSKIQHDEDNHWGLFVANKFGNCWRCYGDNHLNTQQGADNRMWAREAIQASVRDIQAAFVNGVLPVEPYSLDLTPDLKAAADRALKSKTTNEYLNYAPLFIPSKDKDGKAAISVRDPWQQTDTHKWHMTQFKSYGLTNPYQIGHVIENTYGKEAQKPKDYMPTPKDAPVLDGYNNFATPRGGSPIGRRRVRYALANLGLKQYPGRNHAAYYSSEPGPWSDWIDTYDEKHPMLKIKKDPDPRTVRRGVIRQVEGQVPDLNYIIVFENITRQIADASS